MSIDLVALGMIMLLSTPCDVELSVCIGVACTISTSVVRICTAVFALMNSAPNSASAANDITDLITCETFNNAPLLRGVSSLPAMKKFLPDLLFALDSERYDVLLWIAKIISDGQYVGTASSWDAA